MVQPLRLVVFPIGGNLKLNNSSIPMIQGNVFRQSLHMAVAANRIGADWRFLLLEGRKSVFKWWYAWRVES
jgi:hypothetical protein